MNKKNGKWTIKDTRQIFTNDFFTVIEDDVIQPDGKDGKYATIRYKEGVAVLPVDDEGNVYITRQFRYAQEKKMLEALAGVIDDGEEKIEAARREAKEELGIEAEDWKDLGKVESDTSITTSSVYLFLARKLTIKEPEREGTEDIETVKMKLSEAVEKVESGEITSGHTCVLILKAWNILNG